MKVQARPNETVGGLLFRVYAMDSDALEEEFYRLNPSQSNPFLEPGKEYELPQIENSNVADERIEVWT
ncbi:hypothetical protein BOO25_18460 [Vibrio navarrensis]|uniref:hypothetical protein n=1 Tax=Vibrio navarrensis TaxID=29495 RepID=UPI00192F938D|nr:hypothetical protein [Vibrio navarrensis]MBE3670912.1 hypothetical protein [Vibrio navarrensis]